MLPLDLVEPHLILPRSMLPTVNVALVPNAYGCDVRDEEQVRTLAAGLIESQKASWIVAPTERFVLMAGELRSRFGLPGTNRATAILFRDKVSMKAHAQSVDVSVPSYAIVDTEDDLNGVDWSRGKHVMKSRYGVGSMNVHYVNSQSMAISLWRQGIWHPGDCEIEEYVPGTMYHCDSVIYNSKVWFTTVARYLTEQAKFRSTFMDGSVLLSQGPLRERIERFSEHLLSAFRLDNGVAHLELFHTPDDKLVFCEVAARPAGGWIDRMIERAYGVNLVECAIRLDLGLEPLARSREGTTSAAWACVGFYPPASRLYLRQIQDCNGVVDSAVFDYAGDSMGEPKHCSDYAASAVVTAPDDQALDSCLSSLRRHVLYASTERRSNASE